MKTMAFRTLGGKEPNGIRIGYISHPADVRLCLDTLCADVFRVLDCAIYYTPDMTAPLSDEQNREMESTPVFLLPLSWDLLAPSSCRVMEEDLPFLLALGIPVLGIMIGPGMRPAIEADGRFGGVTILDHGGSPASVALYREQLKGFLSSVFGKQIEQPTFSRAALLFLESRTAHSSILDDEKGFVFPEKLEFLRKWIEDHLTANSGEGFRAWLILLKSFALRGMGEDPAVGRYLLGLACLEGLFEAADREKGIRLISDAADAGLPEAMKRLVELYLDSSSPERDVKRALRWQRQLVEILSRIYGDEDPYVIKNKNELAMLCIIADEAKEALQILEELLPVCCRILGERHSRSVAIIKELVDANQIIGDYIRAAAWQEKLCTLLNDPQELRGAQKQLLSIYREILMRFWKEYLADESNTSPLIQRRGVFIKAIRLCAKLDERVSMQKLIWSLADDWCRVCEYEEAEYLLAPLSRAFPDDLRSLICLVDIYRRLGNQQREAECTERAIFLYTRVIGEDSYVGMLRKRLAVLRQETEGGEQSAHLVQGI